MFADDPNYKPHELDKDFSLLEPHQGQLWRMAAVYLVHHDPQLSWEYGICASPGGHASVIACSSEQLKQAIGEDLFSEATVYLEHKIAAYFEQHGITDPRQVIA